jgi:glucan phosphoethanolaminetransferase (alkaline phosphatase superfamily)
LVTLQVQLAAIIALAFGNFYLHVQLLRGHPAIDNVVYGASLADIAVVTALVLVQGGYPSPVFIFYFAAVVGISVAFPSWMTAAYTAIIVGVYGVISLSTATTDELPAVFVRVLMIAAVAVCGNVFARHESRRRAEAIRIHSEVLDDIEQGVEAPKQPQQPQQPQPAAQAAS